MLLNEVFFVPLRLLEFWGYPYIVPPVLGGRARWAEGVNFTEVSSKDITLWRLLTLSFDSLKSGSFLNECQKQKQR